MSSLIQEGVSAGLPVVTPLRKTYSSLRTMIYVLYVNYFRAGLNRLFFLVPGQLFCYEALRRFWIPPPAICRWLRFKGVFRVQVGGVELFLQSEGESVEGELFWRGLLGGWEKVSLGLWIELCKESQVIVDVGANTGIYALVAKRVCPGAKVIGFEPLHRTYRKFERNCRLNQFDIMCVEAAVSNYEGLGKLYDPGGHVYSMTVNQNFNPRIKSVETIVRTLTLASVLKNYNLDRVDLIKIDVEGHEPEVLEGMGPFLSHSRPSMLLEITSDTSAERIERLFAGLGYSYFDIDEISTPRALHRVSKSSKWNLLVCQPEVAKRLGL